MRLIRLGARIQRAQGTAFECLVGGFAIQGTGIHRLVHMGVHGQLPARVLRRGIEELRPEIARTALADSFKAEYVMLSNSLDLYVQGKVVDCRAPEPRFLLKPNQTRRLLGEKIRGWIERDAVPARSRRPLDDSDMENPSSFEIFVLRGAGRRVLDLLLSSCSGTQREADFAPVRLAATRALLAIAAYRAEKGALPDSLEALVPAYLEALPLDPYTGKSFLYSASKMILYSTGADEFDSRGSTEAEAWRALFDFDEPTLRLDPAAWKHADT